MRPQLLERFEGYVIDVGAESFFLIGDGNNRGEQLEIPLVTLPSATRQRLCERRLAYVLVYENRVSFRLCNEGKHWNRATWKRHLKRTRRWVHKHWDFGALKAEQAEGKKP